MNRTWQYKNKTTGTEIESNDLGFLMKELSEMQSFILPNKLMTDLIMRGYSECSVTTLEGEINEITITENRIQ